MKKQDEYVFSIVGQINDLFSPESEDKKYDWETADMTQFFIAYVKAGAYIFNQITGDNKNALEFTHLANSLIVQDLVESNTEFKD
jgi:hypothetical protein